MPAKKTSPRRPVVRRTEALIEEAIECIANGETLSDFCRKPGRPDRRTITRWVAEDPLLQNRFTEARRIGHDAIAEGALQLADAPLPPGPDGRIDPALVQQRRLQVDTRLRLLAKWDSARYGDKVQIGGDGQHPVRIEPQMTDEERAARIQAILARARARRQVSLQASALPGAGSTTASAPRELPD